MGSPCAQTVSDDIFYFCQRKFYLLEWSSQANAVWLLYNCIRSSFMISCLGYRFRCSYESSEKSSWGFGVEKECISVDSTINHCREWYSTSLSDKLGPNWWVFLSEISLDSDNEYRILVVNSDFKWKKDRFQMKVLIKEISHQDSL